TPIHEHLFKLMLCPAAGITYPEPYRFVLKTSLYVLLAGSCFLRVSDTMDQTFLKPVFFAIVSSGILCIILTSALSRVPIILPYTKHYTYYLVYIAAGLLSLAMAYDRGAGMKQIFIVFACLMILYCS